jgi:RNA polymerase sigma factor (sigma-70 family)
VSTPTVPFEEALPALYRAHAKAVVEMAWVYVGDRADAEDVCVDAFIRLHRTWTAIDPAGPVGGYLQAAALKITRSAIRSTLLALRYRPASEPYVPGDEEFAFGEDQIELLAAVRRLPGRQRNPLLLRYWSGLADPEIAAALGASPRSVDAHLRRALRSLAGPDLDARLRALAETTHRQVQPSAGLFSRIQGATAVRARRRSASRWAGAVAAAALILAFAVPLLAGDVNQKPMTRIEFIVQADHACAASGAALTQARLVYPSPNGNKAVATALLAATQRLLSAAYAANPPADARAVLSHVNTELQAALATLQSVLTDVDAGDLARARSALDRFRELTRAAASDLAAYGAQNCVLGR